VSKELNVIAVESTGQSIIKFQSTGQSIIKLDIQCKFAHFVFDQMKC